MTPLRQTMIDAMLVRGMSPRTQRSYLMAVTELATMRLLSKERRTRFGIAGANGQYLKGWRFIILRLM